MRYVYILEFDMIPFAVKHSRDSVVYYIFFILSIVWITTTASGLNIQIMLPYNIKGARVYAE